MFNLHSSAAPGERSLQSQHYEEQNATIYTSSSKNYKCDRYYFNLLLLLVVVVVLVLLLLHIYAVISVASTTLPFPLGISNVVPSAFCITITVGILVPSTLCTWCAFPSYNHLPCQ
jgi:uncharacterized integral membrane protein